VGAPALSLRFTLYQPVLASVVMTCSCTWTATPEFGTCPFGRYKSLEGWVNKDNQDITVGIMGLGTICRMSILVVLTHVLSATSSLDLCINGVALQVLWGVQQLMRSGPSDTE
jgi:hypothetical protein